MQNVEVGMQNVEVGVQNGRGYFSTRMRLVGARLSTGWVGLCVVVTALGSRGWEDSYYRTNGATNPLGVGER
jgi:hypothetical protein